VKLRFSGPARRQASDIDTWWRENRPSSPDLFARELRDARLMLEGAPESGTPYSVPGDRSYRRVVLRRTKAHLYYFLDHENGHIEVAAVWSMYRGRGPTL
jgi:plasmid stabilization system protein ParE